MNQKQAIALLRKYKDTDEGFRIVLKHSKVVQKHCVELAKKLQKKGFDIDMQLLKNGALLHDIGYFKVYDNKEKRIRHGIEGGKILRKEGYSKLARIAERHIGLGISKEDIIKQKLQLPKKDFLPKTIEEKIITYIDNFIDMDKKRSARWVYNRFKRKISKDYADYFMYVHKELKKILN